MEEVIAFAMLATADKSYNSGTIGRAIADILSRSEMTIADCERMLREQQSQTYLVAWPRSFMLDNTIPRDVKTGEPCEFALWICLHGDGERDAMLEAWSIPSVQKNMELLALAGFSTLVEN